MDIVIGYLPSQGLRDSNRGKIKGGGRTNPFHCLSYFMKKVILDVVLILRSIDHGEDPPSEGGDCSNGKGKRELRVVAKKREINSIGKES